MTPVTKMMAHLPLAFHERPVDGLVVCFGMGTSFRSMCAWNVSTTAVELVPSVPSLLWLLPSGWAGTVAIAWSDCRHRRRPPFPGKVADDIRRHHRRPSSPGRSRRLQPAVLRRVVRARKVQAAVQRNPAAVAALWRCRDAHGRHPRARRILSARSRLQFVRGLGLSFSASTSPIPELSASMLTDRLPHGAGLDLVESGPHETVEQQFAAVLTREIPVPAFLNASRTAPVLTDDRPVNDTTSGDEYYGMAGLCSFHTRADDSFDGNGIDRARTKQSRQ